MRTEEQSRFALPFENSYWVLPGKLLAGEYPGRREDQESRRRLQALIRSGIRICVDLTKPGEVSPSYREAFLDELAQYGYEGNYYHFPIYDFGIPTAEQMVRTLDIIDQSIASAQPVYVHCHAGIGRTGLTIGCFLARHGLAGEAALEEITRLRASSGNAWMRSPETDAQIAFVRAWQSGE
jgi:hypothetical protein